MPTNGHIGDETSRPLAGVRVLDISRVVSGPFAGRLLSDLGADVIKVEPPKGDETHAYGMTRAGMSGAYVQHNAGKRNVCIDLKADGGRELLLELAGAADIMIENFRPGVLDRLGLGWEVLSATNPGLILLSITGFGQTGPGRGRRAYAPVIHAECGLVARQAFFDQRPPSDPMPSIADTNAALHGLVAVLAALHMRERTHRGQHVDIAMTDAMLSTDDYSHHALDNYPILRVGGDVWEAVGGPVLTAGLFDVVWPFIAAAHLTDPYLPVGEAVDEESRRAAFQTWLSGFVDRSELEKELSAADIPWAAVRPPMDVFDSDWARARHASAEIDDREGGHRRVTQSPYKYSDATSGVVNRLSYRGEDNGAVLGDWLDKSAVDVEQLRDRGVLRSLPDAADPTSNDHREDVRER